MKIVKTILLTVLLAAGLACGYSSKATTPPAAGTTPTIAELMPDNANSGSSGVVLTINGTNFNSNATINWKGAALTTTFVSASQLMTTLPDADLTSSGTAAVTVTNPGSPGGIYGGGTQAEISNSMTFTIN